MVLSWVRKSCHFCFARQPGRGAEDWGLLPLKGSVQALSPWPVDLGEPPSSKSCIHPSPPSCSSSPFPVLFHSPPLTWDRRPVLLARFLHSNHQEPNCDQHCLVPGGGPLGGADRCPPLRHFSLTFICPGSLFVECSRAHRPK